MDWRLRSAFEGVAWPAVPDFAGGAVLGLLYQLEASQWFSADRLLGAQLQQLQLLLRHAWDTVPYYGEHWAGQYDPSASVSPQLFSRLPLLTRRALQSEPGRLKSRSVPASHGEVFDTSTSGSVGAPVRVFKTEITELFWRAITLRDHLWHERDLGGKLAAIRYTDDPGNFDGWGPATHGVVETGPSLVMGVRTDIPELLRELDRYQPDYLMTYPSLLRELLRQSAALGVRLPRLKEARTFAEIVPPELRQACREGWGVPLTDVYSATEVGYLALQCPEHEHYHVQAESVLLEVLGDDDAPCKTGETGRVVVTDLHNFAMPLIRCEIGDYAEVGEACACGRGLPVLRRIAGRTRNMLVTASGQRYWPTLGARRIRDIAAIQQLQFVQKTYDLIEVRLVTPARLAPEQEESLRQRVLSFLPPGIRLEIAYCDRIARGAGGKFEDFVSEISDA